MNRSVVQIEVPHIGRTPVHNPRQPLASRCTAMACALAVLLSSCAEKARKADYIPEAWKGDYIPEGARKPIASGPLGSATSDAAEVTIKALIVPNGPGSWMKDATWYEVAFVLHNLSKSDSEVTGIRAINQHGVFVDQVGAGSPSMDLGPYTIMPGMPGISCKAMPITPATPMSMQQAQQQFQAHLEDCGKIKDEYQARQAQRATLAPGGVLVASAFFPVSSGKIRELVFSTKEGGKTGEVRVTLGHPATSDQSK